MFKISSGRFSLTRILSGLPTILLVCEGAKSGKKRRIPLIAIPSGENREDIVLIASNWGKPNNPGWYYNLKSNPNVEVVYRGNKTKYVSKEVEDTTKYQKYWNTAVQYYSGYNNYKNKTSRKRIPILLLEKEKSVNSN